MPEIVKLQDCFPREYRDLALAVETALYEPKPSNREFYKAAIAKEFPRIGITGAFVGDNQIFLRATRGDKQFIYLVGTAPKRYCGLIGALPHSFLLEDATARNINQ